LPRFNPFSFQYCLGFFYSSQYNGYPFMIFFYYNPSAAGAVFNSLITRARLSLTGHKRQLIELFLEPAAPARMAIIHWSVAKMVAAVMVRNHVPQDIMPPVSVCFCACKFSTAFMLDFLPLAINLQGNLCLCFAFSQVFLEIIAQSEDFNSVPFCLHVKISAARLFLFNSRDHIIQNLDLAH